MNNKLTQKVIVAGKKIDPANVTSEDKEYLKKFTPEHVGPLLAQHCSKSTKSKEVNKG